MSMDAMRAAAEKGDAQAQASLGYCYDVGDGVQQDLSKAAYWYEKSAEQGYANGQFNFAEMLREGAGVTQSNEKAFQWYLKAAMQNHAKAQYNVAMLYVKGDGVKADNKMAYAWLCLAAEAGADSAEQARDIVGNGIGAEIEDAKRIAADLRSKLVKSDQ